MLKKLPRHYKDPVFCGVMLITWIGIIWVGSFDSQKATDADMSRMVWHSDKLYFNLLEKYEQLQEEVYYLKT